MLRMGLSGAEMSTRCATSRLPVEAVRPPLLRDGWVGSSAPARQKGMSVAQDKSVGQALVRLRVIC